MSTPSTTEPDWPWSDDLDAVIAAPESHLVLLEKDRARVLKVVLEPGAKEPFHTHRWPSIFILTRPAKIRYYNQAGELVFETGDGEERAAGTAEWFPSEGLHAVENIDTTKYEAYRIELKRS